MQHIHDGGWITRDGLYCEIAQLGFDAIQIIIRLGATAAAATAFCGWQFVRVLRVDAVRRVVDTRIARAAEHVEQVFHVVEGVVARILNIVIIAASARISILGARSLHLVVVVAVLTVATAARLTQQTDQCLLQTLLAAGATTAISITRLIVVMHLAALHVVVRELLVLAAAVALAAAVLEWGGRRRPHQALGRYHALQLRVRVVPARLHHVIHAVRVVHDVDVAHLVVVRAAGVHGPVLVIVIGARADERIAVLDLDRVVEGIEGLRPLRVADGQRRPLVFVHLVGRVDVAVGVRVHAKRERLQRLARIFTWEGRGIFFVKQQQQQQQQKRLKCQTNAKWLQSRVAGVSLLFAFGGTAMYEAPSSKIPAW